MLDFIKEKKAVIAVILCILFVGGWYLYNSKDDYEVNTDEILVTENTTVKEDLPEDIIVIHITGEVKKPGVVKAEEGSRVEDIIKAAGGLTENADISKINLAYIVEDGTKIRIPSVDDETQDSYITEDIGEGIIISDETSDGSSDVININKATQTELETLPGIGPSLATSIIKYREENGKFKDIDEIKNVTGIGDNKFEKIKDFIKVK